MTLASRRQTSHQETWLSLFIAFGRRNRAGKSRKSAQFSRRSKPAARKYQRAARDEPADRGRPPARRERSRQAPLRSVPIITDALWPPNPKLLLIT